MASNLSAHLVISILTGLVPPAPDEGPGIGDSLNNGTTGERWTEGQASGNVDRVYRRSATLAAAATHSYNTLAAGSLKDPLQQAIDLDELKGFVLKCTSGAIKLVATAGTPIGLFGAAGDLINIPAGGCFAFSWGATGLNVATNALFEITDTAGGAGSVYELMFIGAN